MVWWILVAVVVLALIGWVVTRSRRAIHTDAETVNRTRSHDEGRGFGPTSM